MSKDSNTEQLMTYLKHSMDDIRTDVQISAAALATAALERIDPESKSPVLVQWACVLELRQLARSILRKEFDPVEKQEDDQQEILFEGLQDRYPATRNGERVYVQLMSLTHSEIKENANRLAASGRARLKHADALLALADELHNSGHFDDTNAA